MTATKLIALRMFLAIVAVAIFPFSAPLATTTIILFLVALVLDLFDGVLADVKGHPKPFGGFLDISADQCIETLFWFLFLKYDLVPLWIPAFILVRNTFINLLRTEAIHAGRSMFGAGGMLRSRFAHLFVGTRAARGVMVVAKMIGFVAAILLYIGQTYGAASVPIVPYNPQLLHATVITSLTILAGIHLVRGAIIIWEGRDYLGAFMWSPPPTVKLEERRAE